MYKENERKTCKSHGGYNESLQISRKEVIWVIRNRCREWMTLDILIVGKIYSGMGQAG